MQKNNTSRGFYFGIYGKQTKQTRVYLVAQHQFSVDFWIKSSFLVFFSPRTCISKLVWFMTTWIHGKIFGTYYKKIVQISNILFRKRKEGKWKKDLWSWSWDDALFIYLLRYTASQKNESTLLHTYVLNEFLTADRSYTTKYFWKNS